MKNLIITIIVASSISLGFTLIENIPFNEGEITSGDAIKTSDFKREATSEVKSDKRLASWD